MNSVATKGVLKKLNASLVDTGFRTRVMDKVSREFVFFVTSSAGESRRERMKVGL